MKPVTAQQIKQIHTILPDVYRKEKELKQNLVYQFTGDADKISTKDMTKQQAEELIYFLQTGKSKSYAHFATFDSKNKQHRYMLSLCHNIGWEEYNERAGKLVASREALGSWLHKYGYLHKPLKDYTEKELPKLITQFGNMVKDKIKTQHATHRN